MPLQKHLFSLAQSVAVDFDMRVFFSLLLNTSEVGEDKAFEEKRPQKKAFANA